MPSPSNKDNAICHEIAMLSSRVQTLEHESRETRNMFQEQQTTLERLAGAVESNQSLFKQAMDTSREAGIAAYREVVGELQEELKTRTRWILIAVACGAAIAGGIDILPALGIVP